MKPPITRRRTTGARRLPRRRSRSRAHAPLRRPLALLYRQSGEARTAAPATVRAADGRSVPIAPRLQIALHLSFAFNEQSLEFPVSVAPYGVAPVMPAATAAPAERTERQASTSQRLIFAAFLRRLEPVYRQLGEARIGSQSAFPDAGRSANAAQASTHQSLVHTRSIDRRIAILGGGSRGQGPAGATARASGHESLVYARSMDRRIAIPGGGSCGQGSAGAMARASGHESLVYARSVDRLIAILSGGSRGQGSAGPTAQADVAPPWPLREEAATWAAYIQTPLPGRGNDLFTRLPGQADAAATGASTRHAPGLAVAYRNPFGAVLQGAGGRVVQRERLPLVQATPPGAPKAAASRVSPAAPAGHPPQGSATPLSHRVQPRPAGGTRVERPARETHVARPATSASLSPTTGSAAARARAGRRAPHRERLKLAQSAPPGAPSPTADRRPQGSRLPFARLARPRPPGGPGSDRLLRERLVTLPGASVTHFSASGSPAARGGAAPLYFAERAGGRTVAPEPFGSVWAPPPLDFRSAAPPPAASPPEEARPAVTTAPSAAPIDLGAVSRDVISRIEKRLRVERERRGRS
jgi:hypothetical protein